MTKASIRLIALYQLLNLKPFRFFFKNNNQKQLMNVASLFTDSLKRPNFPVIVLIPQCPANQRRIIRENISYGIFNITDTKKQKKPLPVAKL